MTSLPSGLASISSQFDDSPQVRGAVAFGRMVREREEATEKVGISHNCREPITSVIDRHAALAIGSAYRSADRR